MNIVVVGDVLLDVDMDGTADRLCPDAPVPVVDVSRVTRRAGGAGLVAAMLARDGHRVRLVTVLSDDRAAADLRGPLACLDVVSGASGAATPVKSRIRAQGQPIVRFDEGCGPASVPDVTAAMLAAVNEADILLVSDYGRGLTFNGRLREALQQRAGEIPLVWDPHPSGADPVPGSTVVTPNLSEATRAAAAGAPADALPGAALAGSVLLQRWETGAVLVTLGAGGAMLLTGDGGVPHLVPAPKVQVADPCGAGDRLAASLAVQLGSGRDLAGAAHTAVHEAAAFLAAGGVLTLRQGGQPVQMRSDSIDALRVAQLTREKSGTVVATGGCFDLLHAGHSRTLAAARALGDCLIVCLNSDASTRRLKGDQRPIIGQHDRAELLLSLECVDAVLVFEEDTPEPALERLRPDLWVKGADYDADELPEAGLIRSWGGRTVTVPYYPAHSTSKLAAALSEAG
ncbi:PfkB family carbohydrate kinase [Arthrobacter sp. A5]|uniref:PfkB family carbohydrate kinase n=1 Tax=Arthrobacter sp. A5 TaxID=576926 RepID=UPI003DA7DD74